MEQKTLAKWLKFVVIGVGICGLCIYLGILPSYGKSLAEQYPEFENRYWPWLIFLWLTAIPCYLSLFFGWRIASNIGKDRYFSIENSKLLQWIAWMAAGDSIFFFVGNIALSLFNLSHPGVVLLSMVIVFAGVAITVAAAALSHLVRKAAALQEESELTI